MITTLVLLCSLTSTALGAVRAYLDREQVYEGDQVRLTIEAQGRTPDGQPDLAPLRKDFRVGGTGTSRQTQIINGRRSDRTSWQIALEPKRLGTLTIPAIAVGSERTEPLTLKVEPVPAGGLGAPGDKVWLEVELGADADELVVQQQVPLTVRAYSAQPLIDYAIEMPAVDGAVLTRIGRDSGHLTTRAGRQYRVIERRFTLNPERSGPLRIPPITFRAELKAVSNGRGARAPGLSGLFDDPMFGRMLGGVGPAPGLGVFERGEPVRARSEALELEVAPAPASFGGPHWLPAAELEVQDSWNPADGGEVPRLVVGEPVTRTLTLVATGLAGSQIPEIEVPVPDGFRVYREQPEAETRSDGETLIGVSRQQVTLIPTRGGDRVLPRIAVPWWDTGRAEERTAVVPPVAVTVAGAVAETPAGAAEDRTGAETDRQPKPPDAPDAPDALWPGASGGWLWSALAVGLGGALFAALALWLWRPVRFGRLSSVERSGGAESVREDAVASAARPAAARPSISRGLRRDSGAVPAHGNGGPEAERRAKAALQRACEHNDARAAAGALLEWGKARWPDAPPMSLRALADRAAAAQRPALEALEQALYGAGSGESAWRGDVLWQAVEHGLGPDPGRDRADRARADDLAPLYPHRT